jgi:lactate dehydrogenase-like 2-hydroxyacid dehydrogenase
VSDNPIDVLLACSLVAPIEQALRARYRVHTLQDGDPDALHQVRALVTSGGPGASAALIDQLPKLEIITVASVGYETVDVAHAATRGIAVTNTPDVLNDDTADVAIALMLMVARRFAVADRFIRAGRWEKESFPLATSLKGKRLGILGLGRIGRAIARRAEAMEMRIAYCNRRPTDAPYAYVAGPVALARQSDVLAVMVSAGPGSARLVNRAVLDALGPTGILVNVSRGMVVDETELVAALQEGRLGGAGLDVFADEPHVPPALMAMDNVVLLPHVGSATQETRAAMGQLVLDNLAAHFSGKPLLTPV